MYKGLQRNEVQKVFQDIVYCHLWQQKYYDQQKYWNGYSPLSSRTLQPLIKQRELLSQISRVLNPP